VCTLNQGIPACPTHPLIWQFILEPGGTVFSFSINKAVQTPYFPELLTKYSGLIIHGCVMLRRQDYLYCYENNVLNRSICAFPGTTILFHCSVLKAADL